MTAGGGTLDANVVAELRRLAAESSNAAFVTRLVEIFFLHAPDRMAAIREAVSRRDAAALERTAHTLTSNCSMLGAMKMADYCRALEAMGGRQAFDEAAALLPLAEDEFAKVTTAVASLRESPKD